MSDAVTTTHERGDDADAVASTPDSTPDPPDERTTGSDRVPLPLDACVLPGRGDSIGLLLAWFVKKSFRWMFFGGTAFASVVHFIERTENELEVNYTSPESVWHGLFSAWGFVVVALLVRLSIGFIALALAYPLARAHDRGLPARTGWTRHYATFSDRYKVAKAFRSLRWTHHVRQVALDRVAPSPRSWWRRIDPIIDVLNVTGTVAFIITSITIATIDLTTLLG